MFVKYWTAGLSIDRGRMATSSWKLDDLEQVGLAAELESTNLGSLQQADFEAYNMRWVFTMCLTGISGRVLPWIVALIFYLWPTFHVIHQLFEIPSLLSLSLLSLLLTALFSSPLPLFPLSSCLSSISLCLSLLSISFSSSPPPLLLLTSLSSQWSVNEPPQRRPTNLPSSRLHCGPICYRLHLPSSLRHTPTKRTAIHFTWRVD